MRSPGQRGPEWTSHRRLTLAWSLRARVARSRGWLRSGGAGASPAGGARVPSACASRSRGLPGGPLGSGYRASRSWVRDVDGYFRAFRDLVRILRHRSSSGRWTYTACLGIKCLCMDRPAPSA